MIILRNIKDKFDILCQFLIKGENRYLKMIAVSSLFCISFGFVATVFNNIPKLFCIAFNENKALIDGVEFVSADMVQNAWMMAYLNFIWFVFSLIINLACISIIINILIMKFEKAKGIRPKNYFLSFFYEIEDKFL